jgi:tripartite-type tricarboxylate transporter receptor subunit TctC
MYGTVTLAVTVTVSNGASHLQDNYLVLAVRRNQRPDDFPNGPTVSSS